MSIKIVHALGCLVFGVSRAGEDTIDISFGPLRHGWMAQAVNNGNAGQCEQGEGPTPEAALENLAEVLLDQLALRLADDGAAS